MNIRSNSKSILSILFLIFLLLLFVAAFYLHQSRLLQEEKLKISDFVGAALAAASVFVGFAALFISSETLRFTQEAEEGQLYIKMMERYSSKEMVQSLQLLGSFGRQNKSDIALACRKWFLDFQSGDDDAILVNEARHRVKYFYRDLMQLYQAHYFSKNLTKRLLNPGGRHLFNNIVMPMEKLMNPHLFAGEYEPFDIFHQELNKEQSITQPMKKKLRRVCLIPARYDASRFPGKLMGQLEKSPGVYKSVIRATLDNISAMGIFDHVSIVTNSKVINDEISQYGGNVIFIEKDYESGTDRIAEALSSIEADIIVNVQGDEPFVTRQPLEDLLAVFDTRTDDLLVVSLMRQMDNENDIQSSDFVKVVCDKNAHALYFSRSIVPFIKKPEKEIPYFEHVGVYGFTRNALLKFTQLEPTSLEMVESVECLRYLENGIPIRMIQTSEHILEIDTEADLINANRLLREGKLHLV